MFDMNSQFSGLKIESREWIKEIVDSVSNDPIEGLSSLSSAKK